MTKLVKKLLISLMAIVMTVCLGYALLGTQPITANAATAEYGLWVSGVKVTSDNLVIDSKDNSAITGTATYDAENNILTLDNFSYTGEGYLYDDFINNSAIIFAENELTVKLVGTNVIEATGDRCSGISSYGLTITDDTEDKTDGVLTITSEDSAIVVGTLSISNVTINATGACAIWVDDGATIINNAIINAIGTSEQALLVYDKFTVENSSLTLESLLGTALDCYGLADSYYTIKNSTLTINSQNKGIRCVDIYVSNSTIEISAVNEAIYDALYDDGGYVPLFVNNHAVYAGDDSASATLIAEPDDTTYENKYVKIVPTYDIWVAGVRLNAENLTIDNEDNNAITGSATYDPTSNTLTLDNFVYSGEGYLKANGDYVAIYVADGTTIKVVGENDIYCNGSYDENYIAIYSEGELTIIGGGSVTDTLKVKSCWGSGIYSENTINFENLNATIITEYGDGVFVNKSYGDVYIKNSNLVVKAYNKGFSLNYAVVNFENSIVAIYSEDEYALWDRSFGGNANRPNYSDSDGDGYRDKHFAFAGIDEEHSFEVDAEDINTFKEYYVIVIPSRKITLDLSAAGQANKEVFAMLGGTIIIDTPTVADYVFIGWYNENTFETLFDFTTPINENITLYAKFANYTQDIANINSQISSVQSSIATLETNLANKVDTTTLTNSVNDLQNQINGLTELTNNNQQLDATQQAEINTLKQQVKELTEQTIEELTLRVIAIETELSAQTDKLSQYIQSNAGIPNSVLTLQGQMTTAQNNIDSINQTIQGLDGTYATDVDVNALKERVATLENAINNAENGIKKVIADLTDRVNEIRTELDKAKQDILTNAGNITANAGKITSLTTQLTELQGVVESLDNTYINNTELATAINNLKTELSGADTEIKGLITALTTRVEKTESDIASLVANKADVTLVTEKIEELKGLINSLDAVKNNYVTADEELKNQLTTAIATAKQEAIDSATELVNNAKAELTTVINSKADTATLNAKVEELNNAIATAGTLANAYTDGKVTELTTAIATAKQQAIDSATELVNSAKAELTTVINSKADAATVNAKVEELNKTIENAKTVANSYTDGKVEELNSTIATAKQQAIDSATELVNNAKAELTIAINAKADTTMVNAKVEELNNAIATAGTLANTYTDGKVEELNYAIATAKQQAIDSATELVNSTKAELNAAIALKADNATVIAKFAEVNSAIAILQELSDDYLSADTELKEELTTLIVNTKAEIIELIIAGDKANADALEGEIAKLRAEIEALKNATNEDIKEAESNAQVLPTVIASGAVLGDIALLAWLIIKRKIVK